MATLTWLLDRGYDAAAAALVVVYVLAAGAVSVHVLLTKEDTRSAIGWVGLAWLSPLVGALLYVILGVNRVRRKAVRLRGAETRRTPSSIPSDVEGGLAHGALALTVGRVSGQPLVPGNRVTALFDGDPTYAELLRAIDGAERSLALCTFLFDGGVWGTRLVDGLIRAHERGVAVRVLVDGIGYAAFSGPRILGRLGDAGVPWARFLWGLRETGFSWLNLRNHRKILVADGALGFTGGMNPRDGFSAEVVGAAHHRDLHARVEGPVVRELVALFAQDWAFVTGELLDGDAWFPALAPVGPVHARVIPDGPDHDLDKAMLTLHAAVTLARRRILIATPYFLPEAPLQLALGVAARRGVEVDVVLPMPSNHPVVDAAVRADLPHLLTHGVRVWADGLTFDHSKLLVVDDAWVCLGSANWDPRSLRLNFEMLFEAHDPALAALLTRRTQARIAGATLLTREALLARPVRARLRDGAARLLKPYL